MKQTLMLFGALLFAAGTHAQTPGQPKTGTLIVNVRGINTAKGGELSTGIFHKENFPKVGKQMRGNETAVTGAEMRVVFADVPAGTYGVASFQDINKDKDLETNFVGLPKEPIGFSRDAKIKMGPPDFDDAAIRVEAGKTQTITITLR